MDTRIFSIIIPIYNGKDTIENALSSLIPSRQYIKEVIISDDRSTDNCIELAHQFDSMLPMVYTRVAEELPHGPGNARNAGLDIATGEWIGFMDCDDAYSMTSLTDIYNTIEQRQNLENQNPLVTIVTSFVQYTIEKNIYTELANNDPSYVHGHYYLRSFLNENNIRFDPNILIIEDGYFNLLFNATMMEKGYRGEKLNGINTYIWRIHINHKGLSYTADPSHQEDTNYTVQARLACIKEILNRFNKTGEAYKYAKKVALDTLLSSYFEYTYTLTKQDQKAEKGLLKWNAKILDCLTKDFGLSKKDILDFCSDPINYRGVQQVYEMHFGAFITQLSLKEFYKLLIDNVKR